MNEYFHLSLICVKMKFSLLFTFVMLCIHAQDSLARVACYYQSWAVYRPSKGYFQISDIDASLCTHHIYAFASVNSDAEVLVEDSYADLDLGGYSKFNDMQKSGVKTMIAIGGADAPSQTFANIVKNKRSTFVNNIVNFISTHGFQGADIDWEYPGSGEKSAFAEFLKDLRSRFDEHGWVLSIAVSAGYETIDAGLDVPALSEAVDFFNVMTYDMHGYWEDKTGENSPMYVGSADTSDYEKTQNVDYIMKYYINKGAPASKLNLGIGTYGVTFTLKSASNNGVGAASTGPGKAGPYTEGEGELAYNEICEMHNNRELEQHWDDEQKSMYAFHDTLWVGFDNIGAVTVKAYYAHDNGYGIMIWSTDMDDFHNTCGNGTYPLLNTINQYL